LSEGKIKVVGKSTFSSRCLDSLYFYRLEDSIKLKDNFVKKDIDSNGYTDLVFTYNWNLFENKYWNQVIALMGFGKDSIKEFKLNPAPYPNCLLLKAGADTNINIYYGTDTKYSFRQTNEVYTKSFRFQFGDFVEPNPHPKQYKITEVILRIGYDTKFLIDKTGLLIHKYSDFRAKEDHRKTNIELIEEEHLNEFFALLSYSNFPSLEAEYISMDSHQQHYTLTVNYGRGKSKNINFNGDNGPASLHAIVRRINSFSKIPE